MNNVTSEIEQKFTDEQFLALAKAFAEAYTEELLKSVEIVITGNKKTIAQTNRSKILCC